MLGTKLYVFLKSCGNESDKAVKVVYCTDVQQVEGVWDAEVAEKGIDEGEELAALSTH